MRPAPGRITPRRCRLIVTAWGWHRFSTSSPAVVHLRFAPDHFFRLRFRSPMPVERRNDAGTYRNPSPRPPPAIISGRGRRSLALGLMPIRRHPAAARYAHDSLCLPRFCNQRIRMERRHRRFLQHSVGVNRPCAFSPGSDHAYYNKFAGESTSSRRAFFVLTPQLQWKG